MLPRYLCYRYLCISLCLLLLRHFVRFLVTFFTLKKEVKSYGYITAWKVSKCFKFVVYDFLECLDK